MLVACVIASHVPEPCLKRLKKLTERPDHVKLFTQLYTFRSGEGFQGKCMPPSQVSYIIGIKARTHWNIACKTYKLQRVFTPEIVARNHFV